MTPAADTIAAIATAPGPGGIAVLRISGPKAPAVLRALFLPAPGAYAGVFSFIPRHMHFGQALDARGEALDEVLAVLMPGPHSFTGEDVAEIHCHGGQGVSTALLEAAVQAGARYALPGEFTRRAFLNGRLDLTQAEAVAEIIEASGRQGVRLAKAKLEGALGSKIASLRAALDALRVQVTLAVDFAEEEAELLPHNAFAATLDAAQKDIANLLAAFERARLWREGALAVLAGRVNVGKSSLLNALLGRERAIVSDRPGTTRDYIEERLNLSGLPLRLIDTAGLRESGDCIENEGMRRARELAGQADIVLLLSELTNDPFEPRPEEEDFLRRHRLLAADGRLLMVMNKADLLADDAKRAADASGTANAGQADAGQADAVNLTELAAGQARAMFSRALGEDCGVDEKADLAAACPVFAVSARTGLGLEALADGMRRALSGPPHGGEGDDIAPNMRQSELLRQSLDELQALAGALADGRPPDILAVHLDAAASLLDEISGASGSEELLDAIFSGFCIGK